MHLGTKICTIFFGKQVGSDKFGNRYFESRFKCRGKTKRWVMYKGLAEPSKVPPEWHGWLHYTFNTPLQEQQKWQKEFLPNLTGTQFAYTPPGLTIKADKLRATGDYEAWKPRA